MISNKNDYYYCLFRVLEFVKITQIVLYDIFSKVYEKESGV